MVKYIESFKLNLQIKELLARQEDIDDSIEEILESSQKEGSAIITILDKERSRISRELKYLFCKLAQLEKFSMMFSIMMAAMNTFTPLIRWINQEKTETILQKLWQISNKPLNQQKSLSHISIVFQAVKGILKM